MHDKTDNILHKNRISKELTEKNTADNSQFLNIGGGKGSNRTSKDIGFVQPDYSINREQDSYESDKKESALRKTIL